MKKDFITIGTFVLFIVFGLGVYTGIQYSSNHELTKDQHFLYIGQYEPHMIMFNDEHMLKVCESYNLSYDYEEAICIQGE